MTTADVEVSIGDRSRSGSRALIAAHGVSRFGDWFLAAALPTHVFAVTGSPFAASAVFIASVAPYLLGAIVGRLLDRGDPPRLIVVGNVAAGIALLPILVMADVSFLPMVAVVVTLVETSFSQLSFVGTLTLAPRVVAPEHRLTIQGRLVATDPVARLVAPPIGGLVYAAWGLEAAAAVDLATYLLAAGLVWRARARLAVTEEPAGAGDGEPAGGCDRLGVLPAFRRLLIVTAVGTMGQGALLAVTVPLVIEVLEYGPRGVGLVMGIVGAGAVAATVGSSALMRQRPFAVLLAVPLLAYGIAAAVAAADLGTAVSVVAFALLGACPVVTLLGGNKIIVERVRPAWYGWAHGVGGAVYAVGLLVGSIVGGLVAEFFSPQGAFLLAATALVAGAAVAAGGRDFDRPTPVERQDAEAV
ncbi:MAG: MFS transporter [Actinomycetota bacterium]